MSNPGTTDHSAAPTPNETDRRPVFVTTRWTVVLCARDKSSADSRQALESLCRHYWYPLYAFVRRHGHGPHDAEDLTQEFFARLLQKDYLKSVAREKGRFRTFLLAALKHFLANEWDRSQRQKRGGGQAHLPLDTADAETRYQIESASELSADRVYEQRWALTLLDQVFQRLRAEYAASGKEDLFEQLKGTLSGERSSLPYAEIAMRLKMSEGAVKVSVHRVRQRYREILRDEIAQTVSTPEEVEDELRSLFAALSG
jgi:RNA polymerase sigma-70 factor (ECF subfamily)